MTDLNHLTTEEMLDDRAASLMDIKMAQKLQVDTIYGRGRVDFIRENERIVQVIEEELDRRGVVYA
jgi:hypothetical protein